MAKHKWFVKTYKTLGINAAQLYTLWFIFFIGASFLFGYTYFLLHPITKIVLILSPLIFFLVIAASPAQKFFFSFTLVFLCWTFSGGVLLVFEMWRNSDFFSINQLSHALPIFFGVGWLLNAHMAHQALKRSSNKEWWLDIRLEGLVVDPHDIQVGHKKIDDYLLIYGEPRSWWEKRLKEPQARSVLTRLQSQGDTCSLTSSEIQMCPDAPKPQVEQWRLALHENPPTSQEWRESGFDFSIPAKDKATAASHPGSPIAVPSLIDDR